MLAPVLARVCDEFGVHPVLQEANVKVTGNVRVPGIQLDQAELADVALLRRDRDQKRGAISHG